MLSTNNEGATKSTRPIQVVLKDHDTQELVFEYIAKLKTWAKDELKNLSIRYDLSQEERETVEDILKTAHEKTENSPNWVYKVRDLRWDLKEVRYRKR